MEGGRWLQGEADATFNLVGTWVLIVFGFHVLSLTYTHMFIPMAYCATRSENMRAVTFFFKSIRYWVEKWYPAIVFDLDIVCSDNSSKFRFLLMGMPPPHTPLFLNNCPLVFKECIQGSLARKLLDHVQGLCCVFYPPPHLLFSKSTSKMDATSPPLTVFKIYF